MIFSETLQMMINGHKIRSSKWSSGCYLYMKDWNIYCDDDALAPLDMLDQNGEYEIYTPPPKAVKVAPAVMIYSKRMNGYYITPRLFTSEQEAKDEGGSRFVKWLIDTPYEIEVPR